MSQPIGNCPGCGSDQPFEQIHAGECPDTGGDCLEWACVRCGAAVLMGAAPAGGLARAAVATSDSDSTDHPGSAGHSVRAA
jgi:hypothetical protein